jgi:hypothetical protein
MRTVRKVLGALMAPLVIVVATVIGTVAAIVITRPGHALLARVATAYITRGAAGRVEIGGISGNIWGHIELTSVAIHDSNGVLILRSPRIAASYVLPELLAGRLVFRNVQVDSLYLHLVRLRAGHWNYEKVFHLGEGPDDGKPPGLMFFHGLAVTDGYLQVDAPTTPGPPHQPASRNGRPPAQDSVAASPDGPVRVYALRDFNARLGDVRVSTPRRDPIAVQILALRGRLNDPAITIAQMAGRILTAADTLRFVFDSASLPDSRLVGTGRVRWPHDTVMFDLALDAPRVALRDLRWIQPDFPDWTGRGHVTSRAYNGSRTDYRLDHLALGDAESSLSGTVTLQVEQVRGVGMRGVDLQLRNTPIDLLRPYLDTLPVAGGLTGHLLADGFLDAFRLGGDLVFADAMVQGAPLSHLRPDGVVHFGGKDGAVFDHFRLSQSTVALATVHALVPSVLLSGTLRLNGQLDGPWQNARFVGTAEHVAPDSATSRLIGSVRLDTRHDVLGVALDADFDPLSFTALRSGYPGLPSRGTLTGHVTANGSLDSLDLHATLAGEVGTITANGRVKVNAPNYAADSLVIDMQRLDLEAVLDTGTSSALNGRVTVTGALDSGAAPRGTLTVALDRSRFGGATVDAVTGVVHAAHGMVTVDTGDVVWSSGHVDVHGTLGWAAPDSGTLTLHAVASSLTPFDSLVRAVTGMAPDTLHPHPLDGQAEATLMIRGARDANTITGSVDGHQLVLDGWRAAAVTARLRADSLGHRGLAVEAAIDTVGVGEHVADHVSLVVGGTPDSLRIAGRVAMVAMQGSGGGTWLRGDRSSLVQLDSVSLFFPHQDWALARPARISVAGGQLTFLDTLRLRSALGGGSATISGSTPGDAAGQLDASIKGLDLLDVFGVLGRDSTALTGTGALELHLAGTRSAPTFDGTASLISPVLGDIHAPSLLTAFKYGQQQLHADVSLWRTGVKVLDGSATLPLDLALEARDTRKLPGALQIHGSADSVDLVVLAAVLPGITNPSGTLQLDLDGSGTWAAPTLTGSVAFHDGAMTIPSLNVRYAPINGIAHFIKDSLQIDSLVIGNADGNLRVAGGIRFPELAKPTLDLRLTSNDFLAINAPSFLTLRARGVVQLTGPILQPVLTGNDVQISRSVLYFADLITKNVIDLEDPENAALIDTTALHRRGLGNEFSNRFLDSLRIVNLQLRIGTEVWLRSAQANIQLDGALRVDKTRKVYALSGDLNAARGTYTLAVGPISQPFTVDQGRISFLGTADMDATLQIQAHHQVRTIDGDDFNVNAAITGTILAPKVTLSSPGRSLSDRDLVSYVLFGQPDFQVTGASQSGASELVSVATNAFLNGASTSVPKTSILTSLTVRPGANNGTVGSGVTQFAAGLQLGPRWFVTFDAGVCLGSQATSLQKRNFGASLEYRITRELRFQAAAEPVQSCIGNRATDVFTTLNRYQLGGNFLWRRDY